MILNSTEVGGALILHAVENSYMNSDSLGT